MPFQSPELNDGTSVHYWQDFKKTEVLQLQALKTTYFLWFPFRFRILLTKTQHVIANSDSKKDIEQLWFYSLRFIDAIGEENCTVSAFALLYQNSREYPQIFEHTPQENLTGENGPNNNDNTDNNDSDNNNNDSDNNTIEDNKREEIIIIKNESITAEKKRRVRSRSSLSHLEYHTINVHKRPVQPPPIDDEDENEDGDRPHHHQNEDIKNEEEEKKERGEEEGKKRGGFQTLFLVIEDYSTRKQLTSPAVVYEEEEGAGERPRPLPLHFSKPDLSLGMIDSFTKTLSLSKREKTKVLKLLNYLKKTKADVRGKGMVVRAIQDHPSDHWGKLHFLKGDIFIAYPSSITGDGMWCLGFSLEYKEGLFYRFGFALSIDILIEKQLDYSFYDISHLSNQSSRSVEGADHSNHPRPHPRPHPHLLLLDDDDGGEMEQEGDQFDDQNDFLFGWLWKKGIWGIWKDWKRRYFILDAKRNKIYYYKEAKLAHQMISQAAENTDSRGHIDVNEITTIHESFYTGLRKKKALWAFEIHTYERVWMLAADREEQMTSWIDKINSIILQNYFFHNSSSIKNNHLIKLKNNNINLPKSEEYFDPLVTSSPGRDEKLLQKFGPINSYHEEDSFELFGAPNGEEIINKYSILKDLDTRLGYKAPPAIEYIFVEPYLNYSSGNVQLSANPYGHAVLRYTLPSTGEQIVMNIVGLANQEMVNFLPPEEYLFSTNFDIKLGNEQGSIYNRNFASIRIQRVPPEKVLAMHQFFVDLKKRSHKEKALYNIAVGPILNLVGKTTYGNCAYYCSQGLRFAGVLKVKGVGSMLPKAIFVDLFEELKEKNQHDQLAKNISVVYYKRIPHAQRFYGLNEDYTGWGRPSEKFTHGNKYDNLEQYADAIVHVPPNSKRALISTPSKKSLASSPDDDHSKGGKAADDDDDDEGVEGDGLMEAPINVKLYNMNSKFSDLYDLDGHIDPRVLFNEFFMKKIFLSTLKPYRSESLPSPSLFSPSRQSLHCNFNNNNYNNNGNNNNNNHINNNEERNGERSEEEWEREEEQFEGVEGMSISQPLPNNFWYYRLENGPAHSPHHSLFKSNRIVSDNLKQLYWLEIPLPPNDDGGDDGGDGGDGGGDGGKEKGRGRIESIAAQENEKCLVISNGSLFLLSCNQPLILHSLSLYLLSLKSTPPSPRIIDDGGDGGGDGDGNNNNVKRGEERRKKWIYFEELREVVKESSEGLFTYKRIQGPSEVPLVKVFASEEYIWLLDLSGALFSTKLSPHLLLSKKSSPLLSLSWLSHPLAPSDLSFLSIGENNEVCALSHSSLLYRRSPLPPLSSSPHSSLSSLPSLNYNNNVNNNHHSNSSISSSVSVNNISTTTTNNNNNKSRESWSFIPRNKSYQSNFINLRGTNPLRREKSTPIHNNNISINNNNNNNNNNSNNKQASNINEEWKEIKDSRFRSILVVGADEIWGVDLDGNVYISSSDSSSPSSRSPLSLSSSDPKIINNHSDPDLNHNNNTISDNDKNERRQSNLSSKTNSNNNNNNNKMDQKLFWQPLGNSIPFKALLRNSSGVYGISEEKNIIYKLSKHRLLVTSTNSARKIWDDRKTNSHPYPLSIWKTLPANGFHCLGHFAERSQLEFPSTESIIVREVDKQNGEIDILLPPIDYVKVWSGSSSFGECTVWRPVPPNDDYVSMGEIAAAGSSKPPLSSVRCVHKNFVQMSKPYFLRKRGYLWSSKGSSLPLTLSVWLVQPQLNSIYCNTFISTLGDKIPPTPDLTYCLKIACENSNHHFHSDYYY